MGWNYVASLCPGVLQLNQVFNMSLSNFISSPSFLVDDDEYVEGYHGTTAYAAAQIITSGFRPSRGGMLGPGVYWSDDVKKTRPYVKDNKGALVPKELPRGE